MVDRNLWLPLHTHSHFSVLDGMSTVEEITDAVIHHGQPGMGLTDHGTMSGTFRMYKAMTKAGLLPFPGVEAYIVNDRQDKKAKRYHMLLLALTNDGYQDIVDLVTHSHKRENYHYKPLLDWSDFASMRAAGRLDGVVATTGCWFGYVQQAFEESPALKQARLQGVLEKRMQFMAQFFPNLHVEIQNHSQEADEYIAETLHRAAIATGIPVLVTQDSHYCKRSDVELHALMKTLAYGGDPSEAIFPGDSYHMASTDWVRSHYIEQVTLWEDSCESMERLINEHSLKLRYLDSYSYHIPQVTKNPAMRLRKKLLGALNLLSLPGPKKAQYQQRIDYELGIIMKLGMSDYFLLVEDLCKFMLDEDIMFEARGSANGSLVCYLLGIISLDPMQWGLTFDRFLSLDRERPPDIDLDVEGDRRGEVIEYLRGKYEVANIGTYSRMGVNEDGTGSILVSFLASQRRRLSGEEFRDQYGEVQGMLDIARIHGTKYVRQLEQLGQMKVYKSPGVHAAGIVLGTEDHPLSGQMPLMLIPSSNTTATMMVMEDVEDGGWVKLDLLGQKSLSVIHRTLTSMGMTLEDLYNVPKNDREVFKFLRKGMTETGVFQMEGYTAAKGCREVQVKSVHDLILINALYRPATMEAGHKDAYLNGRRDPSTVEVLHPIFEEILKPTYGVPVYQEQVMDMLRAIGFPTHELNKMLKAIKQSNDKVALAQKTFSDLRKLFDKMCAEVGVGNADEVWTTIQTFSQYSFNKAHATGYGLRGYYTAWLRVNHPLEYFTALLDVWAGTQKEKIYLRSARQAGVRILGADVNVSGASWTLDTARRAIRRGLVSIKGVGMKAADDIAANAPYASLEDLVARTNSRTVTGGKDLNNLNGVLAALQSAGALDSLEGDQ